MKHLLFCLFSIFQITLTFSQCPVDAGPDKTICSSGSVTLGLPSPTIGLAYSWSPTTGLSNPNVYNPVASPTSTTTYTLNAIGANLITNGDFENGYTGFSSDYPTYPNFLTSSNTGTHAVRTNALVSFAWCGLTDHSTGGSYMLLAESPDARASSYRIWYTSVNVTQNTNLLFSGFASNLTYGGSSEFDVKIIGNVTGTTTNHISLDPDCDDWQQFSYSWNSGNNTQVTLEFRFTVSGGSDNVVALDDLFFGNDCHAAEDDVTVTVSSGGSVSPTGPITMYSDEEGVEYIALTSIAASYYQWYKDGNAISGATGQVYQVACSGPSGYSNDYHVVTSCGTSNEVTVTYVPCNDPSDYPVSITNSYCASVLPATVTQPSQGFGSTYNWWFGDGPMSKWSFGSGSQTTSNSNAISVTGTCPSPYTCDDKIYTKAKASGGTEVRMVYGISRILGCRMMNPNPKGNTLLSKPLLNATLSPNPASNALTISSKSSVKRIDIYSTSGRLVKSVTTNGATNINVKIDDLANGIYSCRLVTTNGIETVKFVVQR